MLECGWVVIPVSHHDSNFMVDNGAHFFVDTLDLHHDGVYVHWWLQCRNYTFFFKKKPYYYCCQSTYLIKFSMLVHFYMIIIYTNWSNLYYFKNKRKWLRLLHVQFCSSKHSVLNSIMLTIRWLVINTTTKLMLRLDGINQILIWTSNL